MSSDNGYRIIPTPDGLFAAQMYFASDDERHEYNPKRDRAFESIVEAAQWANAEYSEYGVRVTDEAWAAGGTSARVWKMHVAKGVARRNRELLERRGNDADSI